MKTAQSQRENRRTAGASPQRVIAFWFADWPVTARALTTPTGWSNDAPVAITHANTVVACSAAARAEGVRRGQRRRDAQAACPSLQIMAHDPDRDARAFSPVVSRIEAQAPGVHIIRPGLCVLRSRGPARYYGGEREAAHVLLDAVAESNALTVAAGIADGPFTAEHAARTARADIDKYRVQVVPPGASGDFLAPLPVALLEDTAMVSLLSRLGVHTLGEFASLDEKLVRDRFAEHGVWLHGLAGGKDSSPVTARVPPPELAREIAFETPLEIAEQVAFAVRQTADEVIAAVHSAGLVCTEVRIEFTDDHGLSTDRVWLHPTYFDAAALVDRVRWQLQSLWETDQPSLTTGVSTVRLTPVAVDSATHHQPSLLGRGTDARVHHALSRVQAILGHKGVVTAEITGGRLLQDRQQLAPWGDRLPATAKRDLPWPGQVPPPLPATIFTDSAAATLLDSTGAAVTVDQRGLMSQSPHTVTIGATPQRVSSWAGPWPLLERTWVSALPRYRCQLVDEHQTAWLLLFTGDSWTVEGRYD